jgi:hypothetical protein
MNAGGLRAVAIAFFVYLYAPILILLVLSFNVSQQATIWEGFSTRWYGVVLANPDLVRAGRNSLLVATTATLAATTIATLAALALDRAAFRGRRAVEALVGLPLLVPEIVTAVATLLCFVLLGVRLGLLTVVLAHTTFCIPFAYLPIRARLADMDPRWPRPRWTSTLPAPPPSAGHPAAPVAGHPVGRDARLHHLARRLRHHLLRQRRRGHDAPGLHLRHDPHRHQPGGERGLGADAAGVDRVRGALVGRGARQAVVGGAGPRRR